MTDFDPTAFAPQNVATTDSFYDSQEAAEQDASLDVTALARSIAGRDPEPAKPDAGVAQMGDDYVEEGAEPAKPDAPQPREDGATWNAKANRWQKPDGSFAEGAAPEGAEPVEATKPETPAKPRTTAYTALDGSDEVDVPDSLTIKFTASNGKEYAKNIDGVVELAKHGIYNHELQQEVAKAREEVANIPTLKARIAELETVPDQAATYVERLLTDMDFLVSQIAEYEQSNTPEAQLERARAELQEERARTTRAAEEREAVGYLTTHIHAPFANLLTQYPGVTRQELEGQLATLTQPFKVNGQVPLKSLPIVAQLVQSHLSPWAAQLHESRRTSQSQTDAHQKAAEEAAAKAQAEAKKKTLQLTRTVARAIAPTGSARSGTSTQNGQGRKSNPKNYREASDQALERALQKHGIA